jgi:flagellar biosynthesis chaperone FliJ
MRNRIMAKLLTLRSLEEGRAETELANQRRLRQACLDALHAHETREHVASHVLHHALAIGDRSEAISAEMALAYSPLKRGILQRQLAPLERSVESAAAAWQHSRARRLQIETVLETEAAKCRCEAQIREQKALDAWFLSSRPVRRAARADENVQRESGNGTRHDGMVRATTVEE